MTADEAYQDYKASRGFMEASLSWSRAATEEDFRLLAVHMYEAGRAEGRREGYAEALKDALARLRELYDITNEPALSVAIEAVHALESEEA